MLIKVTRIASHKQSFSHIMLIKVTCIASYKQSFSHIMLIKVTRIAPFKLEMCMGMGNAGFPSLPWDSHGNGNQIA